MFSLLSKAMYLCEGIDGPWYPVVPVHHDVILVGRDLDCPGVGQAVAAGAHADVNAVGHELRGQRVGAKISSSLQLRWFFICHAQLVVRTETGWTPLIATCLCTAI